MVPVHDRHPGIKLDEIINLGTFFRSLEVLQFAAHPLSVEIDGAVAGVPGERPDRGAAPADLPKVGPRPTETKRFVAASAAIGDRRRDAIVENGKSGSF